MGYFFFLVVDDGGFYRTWPDNRGELVDFSAYTNLVRLAEQFDIQIVLACTTQFFDIHAVSESPRSHKDTSGLIALLEAHAERLIIAEHGYNHQFGESYSEFYDYKQRRRRDAREQERHIDQSMAIYESLGWPVPQLFVAPAHGWEPSVTDRLLAQRGIRYLTSYLWIKNPIAKLRDVFPLGWKRFFEPQVKYPHTSPDLMILPRLGLGIPARATYMRRLEWQRAYQRVVPTGYLQSILLHRRKVSQPHNYMAHIANFAGESNYRQWSHFLERLASTKKVYLVKTFEESIKRWQSHRGDREEGRADYLY